MALVTESSGQDFDFGKLATLVVSDKEKHIRRIESFHIPTILSLEKYTDLNRKQWTEPGKKQQKFSEALQLGDNDCDATTQREQIANLFCATKPPKRKVPKRSSIKHFHIMKRMSMCIVPCSKVHPKPLAVIGRDEVDSFNLTNWCNYQKLKKATVAKPMANTNQSKKWQPTAMGKIPLHTGASKAQSATSNFKQPNVKNPTVTASARVAVKNPLRFGKPSEKQTVEVAKANPRKNFPPSMQNAKVVPNQKPDPRATARSSMMTLHRSTEALAKGQEKENVDSFTEEPPKTWSKVSVANSHTLIHRLSEFLNSPFETRLSAKPNESMSTSQVAPVNPAEPADVYNAYQKFHKKTKQIAEELRLNEKTADLYSLKLGELKLLTLEVKQLVPQMRTDGEAFDIAELKRINALLEDIRTMNYLLDTKATIYTVPEVKNETKLRSLMKVVDGLLQNLHSKDS